MKQSAAIVLVSIAAAVTCPVSASAQSEGLFTLGASTTVVDPAGAGASTHFGVGVVIGRRPRPGWNPTAGLGWFETRIEHRIAGERVAIGSVHVRPILVGYGYTVMRGRMAVTGSLLGGYAPNSDDLSKTAEALNESGEHAIGLSARDSLVARPTFSLTYTLTPRIGLAGTAAMIFTDPRVRVTVDGVTASGPWSTRSRLLSVGLIYGLF